MRVSLLCPDTTWRIHDQNESALLVDGQDYYRAFYAAASKAEKSILLLGWQFDSDVQLVRGDDLPVGAAPHDVQLLALLDRLCRSRPALTTRVLAWDHSVVFALEREMLQKVYFDAITCARFDFRWDDTVPLGGSHHQKVAIIDGRVAFFGSQDLCQSRWDDSTHRADNAHRTSRGISHQPYHEVQVAVTGAAARSLVDLFVSRWRGATGEELDPNDLVVPDDLTSGPATPGLDFPVTLPMPPARIGLARTIPAFEERALVSEVSEVLVRAIESAKRLVYIETQYLTSCAVRDALIARMRDATQPKLEIVIVLPHKPEKLKEEMTVGVPQQMLLQRLDEVAREHGHALGLFNVVVGTDPAGQPTYVYIHSKLLIVDDRAFVVGSANLTNRSMSIDSEIVAVYEASSGSASDRPLRNAIRRARVRLMLEHIGGGVDPRIVIATSGLVRRLNELADRGDTRLRRHDVPTEQPGIVVKAFHELTLELLDPWDGTTERCSPAA